tara:strand:+ start:1471 stop:1668 length:198 start_codon:yes stop_codon:yes gene_type:complete
MNFLRKTREKVANGEFFYNPFWRYAQNLFIKRLFNNSGVFDKKILSNEIKIPSWIENKKRKNGKI